MITYLVAGLIFGLTAGLIIRGIYKAVTGTGKSGCGCGCSSCSRGCLPPEKNN